MNTNTIQHPFTAAELLSFLMEVQADRIRIMAESCHSEEEAQDFSEKIEVFRRIVLVLQNNDA